VKLLLLTGGTYGDVLPFVVLGEALAKRGYDLTIAAPPDFETLIVERGLGFRPIGRAPFRTLLETPAGRVWTESGQDAAAYREGFLGACGSSLADWTADIGRAVSESERVIFHACSSFGLLAMRTRPPCIGLTLTPMSGPDIFGAQALLGSGVPFIHAYSPSLWLTPGAFQPGVIAEAPRESFAPPGLARFLDAGDPPLYVGFGSMTGRHPDRLAALVMAAVSKSGMRAVVATGWGGMTKRHSSELVHWLDGVVPHSWIFPRVSAVVHHGGAGTTAAGLRAGRPTLICPFFADQSFWGAVVETHGLGPRPLPRAEMTVDVLAAVMRAAAHTPSFAAAAAKMGARMGAEDAVNRIVAEVTKAWPVPRAAPPGETARHYRLLLDRVLSSFEPGDLVGLLQFRTAGAPEASHALRFTSSSVELLTGEHPLPIATITWSAASLRKVLEQPNLDLRSPEVLSGTTLTGDPAILATFASLMMPPSKDVDYFKGLEAQARKSPQGVARCAVTDWSEVLQGLQLGRPMVVGNALRAWPALPGGAHGFVERFGATVIKFLDGERTLGEYFDAVASDPVYSLGIRIPPELSQAFLPPFCRPEREFSGAQLWLGNAPPDQPLAPLHRDLLPSFLGHVLGVKRVRLYPPDQAENLYPMANSLGYQPCRVRPCAPDFDRFPRFAEALGFDLFLSPGEMLMIPPGWFHETYAPAGAVLSVSHNLVSSFG